MDAEKFNPYRRKIFQYPHYIKTRREILASPFVHYLNYLARDWPGMFLEIGSGSGNHLIELAKRHPDRLIVGMEIRYKRIVRTAQKAEREGLKNLQVLQWDGSLFHTLLRPESLERVYLNFPDPWPKKRHRKKRMFLGDFLPQLLEKLSPQGAFFLKTDHDDYFQHFLEVVDIFSEQNSSSPWRFRMEEVTWDLYNSPWKEGNIPTEFESLFLHKVKTPIKYCKLVKVPVPSPEAEVASSSEACPRSRS